MRETEELSGPPILLGRIVPPEKEDDFHLVDVSIDGNDSENGFLRFVPS
jgi:hypothetical protein